MATTFSNTTIPFAGPGNYIRTWAQFIEDTLVNGGWVVTNDTGQTLPSALTGTAGTTANEKRGYRVYRMADSLQGTYPVFMRIDYGGGTNLGNSCGIWTTVGQGSNGSGGITGALFTPAAAPNVTNSNNLSNAAYNSYGSAAPGRAAFCCFAGAIGNDFPFFFSIERTKNAVGADTGTGLLLLYRSTISQIGLSNSRYIVWAGGTQPALENGLSYLISCNNPTQSFAPGDIGLGVIFHFKGTSQQPGTNALITNNSDVSLEGQIQVVLYNQARNYVECGPMVPFKATAGGSGIADTYARILMRYD